MSKIYSFRLSDTNPREVQAREVIEAWTSKGYSVRHTLVEALILLDTEINDAHNADMERILNKLETLLESKQNNIKTTPDTANALPPDLLNSIGKTMKAGVKIEPK